MESVTLGKTGITVNKNGFGALPIQRISDEEAVHLLRKAYENGITFFDTARAYSDSEHKLGLAFQGMWDKVYVASKTAAVTPEDFWKDLQTSLTTWEGIIWICISSTIRPSAPDRVTGAVSMNACWKRRNRGKSGISALPTTVWQWRRKP